MSLSRHATAADFAEWRSHAQGCDNAALRFIIADCRSAELAMQGHDPVKEGFYSDQAATYADELRDRRAAWQ